MTIFNDEVLSVGEIAQNERIRLQKEFSEQITKLHHDIAHLQNNISHLSKQNIDKNEQILVIQEQNQVLVNYVGKIKMQYPNTGKQLSNLNRKSASKKLSILKDRVEKALWFAKSFGVTFEDITCTDNSGKKYDLLGNNKSRFGILPEFEKDKVKNILFILDQFCISDEAYHELTVQNNSMVKSYFIKQCRENLNNIFSIKQTPGLHPGAQLDLFETLDRLLINLNLPNDSRNIHRVEIKLAADGAKVSRISSFLVLSLCILNNGDEVMSSSGQHTLAIVSCDEKYFTIKECLSSIFTDINNLLEQKNGEILYETKCGKKFYLEIYLGGDLKFLLTGMGLNAANSKYACLYCKIDKKDRSDMSKSQDFYWTKSLVRNNKEMISLCKKSKLNFGCVHPPP